MKHLIIFWMLGIISSVLGNEFTQANNLFTITAYKQVLGQFHDNNFLVSPFSAETVLAFAQSGCKGETAEEIRNALHLPNDDTKIENGVKNLLSQLKKGDNYTFYTANKMYVQEGYPIKAEFQKAASEIYGTESENIDFTKKEAASVMNTWVEKETNNKIHDLIDSENLNNRSRVVLLNALYFKGDWSTPFLRFDTEKGKFYKTPEDFVEVDMMYHNSVYKYFFNYYECPHLDAKLVELPFKGNDASMTVVLPNQKDGISKMENQMDRVLSKFNFTKEIVNLGLPKFRIESKIDFKQILENLGVKKAFHKNFADLSGISGNKGDLVINEIIQKTFMDVSEEGVEAAAATYVFIGVPISGFLRPPKDFIADHPFIFYIKVKGTIVFAGKVTDPKRN